MLHSNKSTIFREYNIFLLLTKWLHGPQFGDPWFKPCRGGCSAA